MATVGHYEMNLGTNSYYASTNQQLSLMYDKTKKTWSQRLKITKTDKSPTTSTPLQQKQQSKSQQFHHHHQHQINEYPIDYSPGALSRSMKYAEPWLYGTVRGIPARPVHHHNSNGSIQTIYTPIPTEVAIMVCSCPEYLTGTKRDLKKASICKKCKGSRLPLAPIGGTVRLRPTSTPIIHTGRPTSAGTMRLPSTSSKSRPSILDTQNDPYDMMRRTRLLSPSEHILNGNNGTIKSIKSIEKSFNTVIGNKNNNNINNNNINNSRTKSTSPSRGRSRHRLSNNLMTNNNNNNSNSSNNSIKSLNINGITKINNQSNENGNDELTNEEKNILRPRSVSRGKKERWLDSPEIDKGGRRSILHCDVNPYELISCSSLTNNEFSPPDNDDDNLFTTNTNSPNLRVSLNGIKTLDFTDNNKSPILKINNYNNVQAIAGQRISLGEQQTKSSLITQNGESFLYDNDNLSVNETITTLITSNGDNFNLTNYQNSPKIGIKKNIIENDKSILYHPKKPPRRKHELCSSTDEDSEIPLLTVKKSNNNNVTNIVNDFQLTSVALSQISTDLATTQKYEIKSILKRPSSVSSTLSTSSASDNDAKYLNNNTNSLLIDNNNQTRTISINSTDGAVQGSTNKIQILQKSISNNSEKNNYENITTNYKNIKKIIGNGNNNNNNINNNNNSNSSEPKNNNIKTGSQFYLPFPQARKKVQFMVEDKIIHDESSHEKLEKDNTTNCKKSHIIQKNEILFNGDSSSGSSKDEQYKIDDDDHHHYDDIENDTEQFNNKDNNNYYNNNFSQQRKQNEIIEHLQMKSKEITEKNLKNCNKIIDESLKNINNNLINGHKNVKVDLKAEDENDKQNEKGIIKENQEIISMEKPRTNSLRRTNSERCTNNMTTSVVLNFNDTMALRIKNNRRTIFPVTNKSGDMNIQNLIFRPKEPPPPPPSSSSSSSLSTVSQSSTTTTVRPFIQNTTSLNASSNIKKNLPQNKNTKNVMTSSKDVTTTTTTTMKTNEKNSTITTNQNKGLTGKQQQIQQKFVNQKQSELEKLQNFKSQPSRPPRQINNNKKITTWNCNDKSNSSSSSSNSNSNNNDIIYDIVGGSMNNNKSVNGLVNIKDIINERYDKENSADIEKSTSTSSDNNIYENFNDNQSLKIIELNDYNNENIKLTSSDVVELIEKSHNKIQEQNNKKQTQAQNEISNGSRLFGNNNNNNLINKYGQQKTVVRVAPFNKTTSEIHRLKINHTDDNNLSNSKKTSILINGDDCYQTVNVTNDTQLYQSSVVVTDSTIPITTITNNNSLSNQYFNDNKLKNSISNTVTINVSSNNNNNNSSRTPEEEIIYKNNKINTLLSMNATKSIIPINSTRIESNIMQLDDTNNNIEQIISTTIVGGIVKNSSSKRGGRTLITLDFEKSNNEKDIIQQQQYEDKNQIFSHEEELVKILRNPVEAVRRNLIPHVCGKNDNDDDTKNITNNLEINIKTNNNNNNLLCDIGKIEKSNDNNITTTIKNTINKDASILQKYDKNSFIGKLLEDPTLNQLADGLDGDVVIKLIENSLKRLKENRNNIDTSGTKDNDDMTKLIDISLQKIKEERIKYDNNNHNQRLLTIDEQERQSNRGSISSGNSYSSANYELFDFDNSNNESDCYQSCSSELTTCDDDTNSTRNKFYQMLVDATLSEIEITTNTDDDHHYESIRLCNNNINNNINNNDPIYEEINEIPPPLPLTAPPLNDIELDKKSSTVRSMFEGASKYDILSYLVDARERGIVREEGFEYNFNNTSDIIIEEEIDTLSDLKKKQQTDMSSRISHLSITSDSSEDTSLTSSINDKLLLPSLGLINGTNDQLQKHNNHNHHQQHQQQQQPHHRKPTGIDIERNDSGVGSETSKSSRSKYQNPPGCLLNKNSPLHLCEDCDGPVETQITDSGVMYAPLVCRKCGKKRAERKEIITEIVETEEKYGRDLQIILEEFCQPMFVAGLLTQEQLSAIFLNTEELLENNQTLAERMRDGLDIALEQGDDDLLTVNIGKIFLESTPMLHAFESYCVRQAASSLLLANLEKEKELLRIFLRVSQMENTVLRRMNLNSFLMVPVQRVTKYPLLLARLFKVTPNHLDGRDLLKQAQEKIELHLNHMNQEAKDVPTKLWRRISSSSPNRRASCEIDMINIKLRKMAIDILEWNHDEVRFAMEGKLLFTQPTDGNWKKGRTIKLTTVNSLLVTNGKPSTNYKIEKALTSDQLNFPKHTGIREASLLLFKEKCGRYTLIREPLYLDKCIICTEADWDDYFEVHEISSKDTFIFKAEDGVRTKHWYKQLQYHAQGMGAWRKRRNALANIMINGMLSRT